MLYDKVVKVYATTQAPDYDDPWQTVPVCNGTGSGVVIGPREILTGAHVVADATFIRVKRAAIDDKVEARVKAICHDSDLALLEIVSTTFLEGIEPAEIGELPDLRDEVSVVGFPVGGQEISVTEGVVSRVEVQEYSHSQRELLAVTVDAAINEGNSGGPVFMGSKMIGIAFQTLKDAENIGEIVPTPLIRHFLAAVAEAKPTVVPALGLVTQNLENPTMRRHLKLGTKHSGVVVTGVKHGGSCHGVLRRGDVLLRLAGLGIANDGTVQYQNRFRTAFHVVLADIHVGDTVRISILRDGVVSEHTVTAAGCTALVRRSQYDSEPQFYVYAGLVLQALSRDLLGTWDTWWEKAPTELLYAYYFGKRSDEREELVVLSQVLADEINVGYEHLYSEVIAKVNGVAIRGLDHMVGLLDSAVEGPVIIETGTGGLMHFEADACLVANQRIRERYQVAAGRTSELRNRTGSTT